MRTLFLVLYVCAIFEANASGLARYQRGDQGPDDNDEVHIDTNSIITDTVIPPMGGPNVCRSRSRTFCCPGWHQRGTTGLCLVPVCSDERCGSNGRCIKPNLCLCDGGKIASHCGQSIENEGKKYLNFRAKNKIEIFVGCSAQCLNGGSCRNSTCICRQGYAGEHCQEPVCKKQCENGGRCIGPNR